MLKYTERGKKPLIFEFSATLAYATTEYGAVFYFSKWTTYLTVLDNQILIYQNRIVGV